MSTNGTYYFVTKFISIYIKKIITYNILLIFYSIHNYMRSNWNALSFFCIIHFKYILPLSFFMTFKDLLLIYPIVFFATIVDQSFLTFVSKSYIGLGSLVFDRDKFRAIYFLCLTVLIFFLYFSHTHDGNTHSIPPFSQCYHRKITWVNQMHHRINIFTI